MDDKEIIIEEKPKKQVIPKNGLPRTLFSSSNQPKSNGVKKGYKQLKTVIEQMLFANISYKDIDGKPKKGTVLNAMVAKQIMKACKKGDLPAYKEVLDRCFGKAKESIEHSGGVMIAKVDLKDKTPTELNDIIRDTLNE